MPPNDADEMLRRIGRRVVELRAAKGWTQAVLAEVLDVSNPYIASIEGGHENLTVRSLCKLADALGVHMREVMKAPRKAAKPKRGRPRGRVRSTVSKK